MKTFERMLAISIVLVASHSVQADVKPSFDLEHCAWNAADVVIVSGDAATDGKLRVLKVLAGSLKKGDAISVPKLDPFRAKENRTVRSIFRAADEEEPPQVLSGDKMVLFLKREGDTTATNRTWTPASHFGGIKVSFVWIDEGRVYGFMQMMNPGPCMLTELQFSEDKLENRVLSITKTRNDLLACGELADAEHRAKVAAEFTNSPLHYARDDAFKLLSECGKEALPHLRTLLHDQSKVQLHDDAIKALGSAGGEAVLPELTAIVEKELSFWKKTAPDLEVGWWNGKGLEWKQVELLRDRYSVVLETLYTLRKLKSPKCESAVTVFRDYWRSLPQLEDNNGLDQMSQACDAVLNELPEQKR